MRRLLLLLIGWAVAWAGLRLLGDGAPAPYLLRDALLLLLPGAALFAWHAPAAPPRARTLYAWPGTGRALFVSGAATALAGAALSGTGIPFAAVVWLIGLGILLAGVHWPAAVTRYTPAPDSGEDRLGRRFVAVALLLALVAGAALRFWRLGTLPPACTGDECARALALAQGAPAALPTLDSLLGSAFYFFTGDGLLSVRLAGALLGLATLPALFALGRQVGGPAAALLATLLLALDPAHVAASRAGDPWIALPLLAALALWAGWRALAADDHRRWAIAGLTVGLLALHAPALLLAWALWFAAMLALAAAQQGAPRGQSLLLLAAAALAAAAPLLWSFPPGRWVPVTEHWSLITQHWPLVPALAALAWVGAAALARRGRPALLYFAGLAALLLALLLRGDAAPERAWLAPAAWLFAGFAAACAALLATALRAGRPLLRVRPAFALLFAAALAVGIWRGGALRDETAQAENPASAALAATIAAALGDSTGATVFAPATVLDDPRVQLAAAPAIAAGRLRLLDPLAALPYTGEPAGDLLYVFTPAVAPLADVARQLYPDGRVEPLRAEDGSLLFTTLHVPAASVAESRGLRQYLYSGGEFGGADEAQIDTVDRSLDFGWAAYPPLPGPFSVEWQGSLVAPLAGRYVFAVQAASGGALFNLLLDGQLTLDTTAGLISHTLDLPAGVYRLDMRYRPGAAPGDLAVLWQPPGRDLEPIPAGALHAQPAPASGLVGTYTEGTTWEGAPIARRKDWLPGADPALAAPYGAEWLGKLAASRAGETLLGAVSDGTVLVEVDGQRVIERLPGPEASVAPSEGAIYLEAGWHDLSVRYATDGAGGGPPELKLYWQPPGAQPEPLPVAALAPTGAPITAADRPLPPPPELADARLGDDTFALTVAGDLWHPAVVHPPAALPYLPLEQVAAFGACGSGAGQFAAPHGLAFDATGATLFVADTGNRRVVALDTANGTARALPGDFEEPVDVEVAPDGAILALDAVAARVVRYPAPDAPGAPLPLPNAYRPRGLGTDALGMIYVADTGRGRIALVAPDGSEVGDFGGPGSALAAGQPVDVLAAPNAIWAVTPVDGRLWQLNTQGSLGVMAPGDTLDGPHLAKLPGGGFFLSIPKRAAVVYFDARGRPLGELSYAGAFALPTGVAAHLDGDTVRLAVADTAACTISLWEMPAARLPG